MNQEREFDTESDLKSNSYEYIRNNTERTKKIEQQSQIKYYATGSILPLGDGLTGKSVLSRLLANRNILSIEHGDILLNTKKSMNIEMEFASDRIVIENKEITASLQFYIFPGQRQKEHKYTTTFEEILSIFDFFPALEKVSVMLLIYDVTRSNTLKSLEMWLKFALVKEWIYDKTLLILVSNKIDMQNPDERFVNQLCSGILSMIRNHGINIFDDQVKSVYTSCVTLEGISTLRREILEWIARKGLIGIGTTET